MDERLVALGQVIVVVEVPVADIDHRPVERMGGEHGELQPVIGDQDAGPGGNRAREAPQHTVQIIERQAVFDAPLAVCRQSLGGPGIAIEPIVGEHGIVGPAIRGSVLEEIR